MEYAAIFHDMDKRFCYAIDKDLFVIRVQVKKDDMKEVILHYEDKYIPMESEDTRKTIPMKKIATSQFHDYYEAQLQMHLICLRYYFEFTDMQGEKVYYGNYEFNKECITNRDRMFDCPQNLREEEMFEVPKWAANKVVYQVFPSRYAASQPVEKDLWYKAPVTPEDNLHGDLRGVIEHLDYIQKLGIDVLYLTPIFKSNSCHKYDTIDYYQIDPSFGTTEDLKELVQKAHECGMKVVLDAVFNHTGREFFAFADIMEKQEKSKYLDWYFIEGFPLKSDLGDVPNFKSFAYYAGMPKLNLKNPEVEKFVTDVACHWIKECDIDGWRMDVGDEISHFFWKRFRKAIKAVKKDMLIIGEIWHYAGDFLEGDEWDTVMNYPFYLNLIDLLADEKITVSQFVQNLGYLKGRLNKKCYPLMWNLIDSHDTARFLHLCDNNKKKQHLACLLYTSWAYTKRLNIELGRKIAGAIVSYAEESHADVIVFEHLEMHGKISGKKKQKLHLWRKRDIQKRCGHKAHRKWMRISHVCAWNTSRLAYDGSGLVSRDPQNYSLCTFRTGKRYHCDLSASYNIGARYFIRELLKPLPETERSLLEAKVPSVKRRTSCVYADLKELYLQMEVLQAA